MWFIYTVEYYSAIKSETWLFAATWMDIEIVILSKVNHKKKKISYDIAYMWNLKM